MHDLKAVSSLFDLRGDFVHGYSYGSGHINDTYCIWVDQAGQRLRYILQRVNHNVFKQPIPLMENVKRVTDHALKRLKEEQCPGSLPPHPHAGSLRGRQAVRPGRGRQLLARVPVH